MAKWKTTEKRGNFCADHDSNLFPLVEWVKQAPTASICAPVACQTVPVLEWHVCRVLHLLQTASTERIHRLESSCFFTPRCLVQRMSTRRIIRLAHLISNEVSFRLSTLAKLETQKASFQLCGPFYSEHLPLTSSLSTSCSLLFLIVLLPSKLPFNRIHLS